MFNVFSALNNPEKQEFLFPFPFEEAIVSDSGYLLKGIVFNSQILPFRKLSSSFL